MAIELEKFAWPGGYTILYVFTQSRDHLVLCWECATKAVNGIEQDDEKYGDYHREGSFINWEGESSWCDDCGVELPPELGNPNEPESQQDDEWRKAELPPYELDEKGMPIDSK